jgi:hypothetical protein
MAEGSSRTAPGRIYIEISQPNDRGSFFIKSTDWTNQKVICENRMAETASQIQYLYTARLLENPNSLRQSAKHSGGNVIRTSCATAKSCIPTCLAQRTICRVISSAANTSEWGAVYPSTAAHRLGIVEYPLGISA